MLWDNSWLGIQTPYKIPHFNPKMRQFIDELLDSNFDRHNQDYKSICDKAFQTGIIKISELQYAYDNQFYNGLLCLIIWIKERKWQSYTAYSEDLYIFI